MTELIESINKLIEEIGTLKVQKYNLKKEYKAKKYISDCYDEEKHAIEENICKKRIITKTICYIIFCFVCAAAACSALDWRLCTIVSGSSGAVCILGNRIINKLFVMILEKKLKVIGNIDPSAHEELVELYNQLNEVKNKLDSKKQQLQEERALLLNTVIDDGILKQEMIAYNRKMYDAYSYPDVEMDIQKDPYAKN